MRFKMLGLSNDDDTKLQKKKFFFSTCIWEMNEEKRKNEDDYN